MLSIVQGDELFCERCENDEDLGQSQVLATRNWHVGGLPVIDEHDRLVGMITYTNILREFVRCDATN